MAILDSRDTELRLWQESGVLRSPGVVLLQGGEYQFGREALSQARLRPRDSNNRFWWQLGTQPLKPALGAARHTADLVHSHLRHIHEAAGSPPSLALAVPDSMPREQLSLLLGIAQTCDFSITGLTSRSILLGSSASIDAAHSRVLHLEAQLHQAVINELKIDNGWVSLLRTTPLPACGLLALQERCVSAIASAFIQQTRFDPRRSAQSEQTLYNELPGILAALGERGEASVDIDGHRARVTAGALDRVGERLAAGLGQVLDGDSLPVLIDAEFSQLPGMQDLPGLLQPLADNALWEAFLAHREAIEHDSDDLHLVDRLPLIRAAAATGSPGTAPEPAADTPAAAARAETAAAPAPQRVATIAAGATHVLVGTRAMPLRGAEVDLGGGFVLRANGGHWTLHGDGALINGLPSTAQQPLALGDTLSLGAAGHGRLIEVLD